MKRIFIIAALLGVGINMQAVIDGSKVSPRTALKVAAKTVDAEVVSAYLTVDADKLDRNALKLSGVKVSRDYGDILTVRGTTEQIASLKDVEGVKYIEVSTQANQMLDIARDGLGVSGIHAGEGLEQGYTGKGVVVGIVDAGFDYGHAAFRDSDGNLRIKRVWEQSTAPSGSVQSPEGFGYGAEMTTAEQILDAGGDIRNNSHGTHVTSIAAGSDGHLGGALRGMAPDADIVLVSFSQSGEGNVGISDAIAYIFDYAEEVGKPCVVNLSLGGTSGPHDGTSTFDVIADRLVGPGRLIVGSAGNNRSLAYHLRRDFAGADAEPLRTVLDYNSSPASYAGGDAVEVWAEKGMEIEFSINCVKVSDGSVAQSAVVASRFDGVTTVSLGRNISGDVTIAAETSPLNGKRHIVVSPSVKSMRTGYVVGLEVKPLSAGYVDMWCDGTSFSFASKNIPGYVTPIKDMQSTICEIGGTANRILTVGAYVTRSHYTLYGDSDVKSLPGEVDGQLGSFSSVGPTADGRVKPQVTAPGCFISGAVSNFDGSGTIYLSEFHNDGERDNMYGFMQGTSMSSPFVTGIVAIWLQAYPKLTPEQLVDIIAETSQTDSFTGKLSDPSNLWGYGKINALGGLNKAIELAKADGIEGIEVDAETLSTDKRVFNLQGIQVRDDGKLNGLPSGIYIIGNKKYNVR